MSTVLVWILISSSGHYSGFVTYSPPVASLADCERMRSHLSVVLRASGQSECVQVKLVVPN